jgi:hypothetical protein
MDELDEEDLDIYITNSTFIIEDKLIIYLKEKREDRKVNIKTLVFY